MLEDLQRLLPSARLFAGAHGGVVRHHVGASHGQQLKRMAPAGSLLASGDRRVEDDPRPSSSLGPWYEI